MPLEHDFWFPAKRYGWGWGLPVRWEGWLTFAVWLFVVCAAGWAFMPHRPAMFLATTTVATALLTGICYLKGEPPGWRWGR